MSAKKRVIGITLLGIGLAVLVLFIALRNLNFFTAPSITPTTLRISTFLNAIDYAPYIIARKNGWIEEALKPLNASVQYLDPFQSPPSINEAFATAQLDAIFTAEVPTIIGRAAGIDVSIAWLSATLRSEVVVRPETGILDLAGLRGRKVAVLAGTSPHYGLVNNLEKNGFQRTQVEFVNMAVPEARSAFESGLVDAWAIWPPFVEQEVVAGKGKILKGVVSPVQVVLAVRQAAVMQNPDVFRALLGALDKAKQWIIKNPEEAQSIVSQELKLPLQVVQMAWPKIQWDAQIDETVIADINGKAKFLLELGFIKRNVDVSKELLLVPLLKGAQ